jgi:hypothetical protein
MPESFTTPIASSLNANGLLDLFCHRRWRKDPKQSFGGTDGKDIVPVQNRGRLVVCLLAGLKDNAKALGIIIIEENFGRLEWIKYSRALESGFVYYLSDFVRGRRRN